MVRRKKPIVDDPEPIVKAKVKKKRSKKKKATRRIRQPLDEKISAVLQVLNRLDRSRKSEITVETIDQFMKACVAGLSVDNAALVTDLNRDALKGLIELFPEMAVEIQRRRSEGARLVTTAMFDKAKAGDVNAAKLWLGWHRSALPELQQITQVEISAPDDLAEKIFALQVLALGSVPADNGGGSNRLAKAQKELEASSN